MELLEPSLLARLENYRLIHRQPISGDPAGERRSRQKGGAVEFADYREYARGDEPRRIDWKAYARLRRLYVREFLDDRQDCFLLVIDTSASMDWGGEDHKGLFALSLAAGLGLCGLAGQDRVAAVWTAGSRATSGSPGSGTVAAAAGFLPPCRGRQAWPRLEGYLSQLAFGGHTDLAAALQAGQPVLSRVHTIYLFSDLWDFGGLEHFLQQAAGSGAGVTVFHILAPAEWRPQGEGDWLLVDAEAGAGVEVSLTPGTLAAYRERLQNYCRELDRLCRRWGARRVPLDSGRAIRETILENLPRAGVVRPR